MTDGAVVVQSSVLLRRYERDRIENLRVEVLRTRDFARLEEVLLEPRFLFVRAPALRFRYRKSDSNSVEVFIACADAHEFLGTIRG